MLDPRLFRDAEAFAALRQRLAARGAGPDLDALLQRLRSLAEQRRAAIGEADAAKAELNAKSREVGERKRRGVDASDLLATLGPVSARAEAAGAAAAEADAAFADALRYVPNVPAGDVPPGDATHNVVVRSWGEPAEPQPWHQPHWDLGKTLGLLDLERGARLAGSGFPLFVGRGAKLERGLIALMLDLHTREHGYTEVSPPFLVNRETMTGTGQLPKFEEDLYRASDDLFLIPTAEVPVTNLHRGEVLLGEELPKRYVSYTPCFRREAGAHGADTRGLTRVHQFDKVELVRIERPEASAAAHEELTRHAEAVLQRLELPYRVVLIAAGDMGFANYRQYDLEVWAPGARKWLEVSSCSTYQDFQARRMDLRFRSARGAKPEYVHTLNGSALALPRTVIALLETGQQPDGSVRVPQALAPYLGTERLEAGGR
ncbi:MAG TPA: serine--tRNA ligase [Gemmatimonadales bacterium]|nr:serine--tRNA ligase [Gemmatimonadales bacterium]